MSDFDFLEELTNAFSLLPGVGKKTASRYAYSVVDKMSKEDVVNFAESLLTTKEKVRHCSTCGMLCLSDECSICKSSRDKTKIMVVKDTKDVIAIEKTGVFDGVYHTLGGLISPLDGIGPNQLNIDALEKRLEGVDELILATPFSQAGETTALYLEKLFAKYNVKITRLGYGLPAGGDIEYVDELTLSRAIKSRSTNN